MLPFIHKKSQENPMANSEPHSHGNALTKVKQDIAFLTDRINAMKAHSRPNTMLIEHYESMLKSRESVMRWLLDGCDDETSYIIERHTA